MNKKTIAYKIQKKNKNKFQKRQNSNLGHNKTRNILK